MNKKFKTGIALSILAVAIIAVFDIFAANSGVFGSYADYTVGNFTPGWWNLFYKINLVILFIVPVCYYIFANKDIYESIALFITSYVLWFFGLADALYFLIQGKMIPDKLPWLNEHMFIGKIGDLIGNGAVTKYALIVSIIIGFTIIYLADKQMEKIQR